MNLFVDRHQQLLSSLLDHQVDFIIIGGYSVIYHGYNRTTGDVDIWLKPENENKEKLLPVLKEMGLSSESVEEIRSLDFTRHLVFSIWEEPEKVDFLTYISIIKYEEADQQKIEAEFDGLNIPFLHLHHLILSKINTGRLKDKADVEVLQKLQQYRKDNS